MTDHPDLPALQALVDLDRLVHEPARLAILTVLASAEWVEWRFLETVTRLSKGNLSSHVARLEAAGYVEVAKGYRGRVPLTTLRLAPPGRAALEAWWARLQEARPGGAP